MVWIGVHRHVLTPRSRSFSLHPTFIFLSSHHGFYFPIDHRLTHLRPYEKDARSHAPQPYLGGMIGSMSRRLTLIWVAQQEPFPVTVQPSLETDPPRSSYSPVEVAFQQGQSAAPREVDWSHACHAAYPADCTPSSDCFCTTRPKN